ncbi:homogentisate 1,2-dioxygenase [Nitrococcus mobilis]|uniref:Homogentisate 1,2-dioxygenase n=1 Tax=Nitrococcus mobilis Nb-231 TaxID=314278 RepID=A4BNU0_9GAMM|nr:homogentisate 1,2-dioxygenase [Nitrococcus mobilis]EAR22889.1 homogentisate 1,2-dioxygenase [Nitrococcus mobilis Nb-231]
MAAADRELQYMSGFHNDFQTEALPGALPIGRNSPQRAPYGLYPEQLSGTAFTAPRAANRRSWLYRTQPSVVQAEYRRSGTAGLQLPNCDEPPDPNPMRWDPLPIPQAPIDFIAGLLTYCVNGDIATQAGCGIHLYACNQDMTDTFFYDADGELLIVPQLGELLVHTEMGRLALAPGEIAVIPRGVKFQVRLAPGTKTARGYVCENFGTLLQLPERGPIGANGLASARDFLTPIAAYEQRMGDFTLLAKFQGHLWACTLDHSPLDVVAWHGNYAPYKYPLTRFNVINTVSFDHPDPSIFTVLSSPSATPGTANLDFVIFPPRWLVAEDTFRPPYFHRNVMSEFMGLVHGAYDAKAEGFQPGGASLHNCLTPHGPDAKAFKTATQTPLQPVYLSDTLAFMFESRYPYRVTAQALNASFRQHDYVQVWQDLAPQFDPPPG